MSTNVHRENAATVNDRCWTDEPKTFSWTCDETIVDVYHIYGLAKGSIALMLQVAIFAMSAAGGQPTWSPRFWWVRLRLQACIRRILGVSQVITRPLWLM